MKAILTSGALTLLGLFFIITGCGGGSTGTPHIGSPIGPFLFMVGQTSDNLFSFKGSDSGAISPIASVATGHAPSAVVMESLSIDQMNLFVADSAANNLTVFNLNPTTGMATPAGVSVTVGSNPMAIGLRPPSGIFISGSPVDDGALYVLNTGSNSISGFTITDAGGHLAAIPGSPFATQANPQALAVVTSGTGSPSAFKAFVYVANGALGTISGFKANADGSLTELAGSPFPAGANITALLSRPGGGILMASDAGNNKVLGFNVDGAGALTPFLLRPLPPEASPAL